MSSHPNNNKPVYGGIQFIIFVLILIGFFVFSRSTNKSTSSSKKRSSSQQVVNTTGVNPIERMLKVSSKVQKKDGIAVALLIDTSGSMEYTVPARNGQSLRKIAVAQRCTDNLLGQIDRFCKAHPDKPVLVGIYEFSSRDNNSSCRNLVPMGKLNHAAAIQAVNQVRPDGGTPIGDAMIDAKRDLDATGMSHLHILVLTDGENNQGYSPSDVADVIFRQPQENQASIYFIAFDVAEKKFKAVKDAGVLVLPAANEHELQQTLDYVLTGKILAEQPEVSL